MQAYWLFSASPRQDGRPSWRLLQWIRPCRMPLQADDPSLLHTQAHSVQQPQLPCYQGVWQISRCDFQEFPGNILTTHTHTQLFNGLLSGTTRVGQYEKKHSPTHTHPDHLPPFTTIHGILFVQFTSLKVLSDNISPGPLWSSSWPWTLNFILHAFLDPIIIFSQHMN